MSAQGLGPPQESGEGRKVRQERQGEVQRHGRQVSLERFARILNQPTVVPFNFRRDE